MRSPGYTLATPGLSPHDRPPPPPVIDTMAALFPLPRHCPHVPQKC